MRKFEYTNYFVMRKIVDETILVPSSPSLVHRDSLLVLNDFSAWIIEEIRNGKTYDEILAQAVEEFDESENIIHSDIDQFLKSMVELEAIRELSSY